MASKETPAAVEYEKLKKASTDALQKKLLKHIELDKEQIMAAAREKLYSWILIKKSLATGTLPILERFREKSQPEEKPAAASATSDMQILFQQNQMFLQQILKEAEDRRIAMEKEAGVRQSLLLKEAEDRRIAMEKEAERKEKEAERKEKEADERIKMMRTWFEIKDEAAIREKNMREEKEKVEKEEAEKLRAEENEKRIQREEEENARRMQRKKEILEEENKTREAAEIEHREYQENLLRELHRREEERENLRREEKERDRIAAAEKEARRRTEFNSRAERLARAVKSIDKMLPKMRDDEIDVPGYFRNVENIFNDSATNDDLKITLLMPHMNIKAKKVVQRLTEEQRLDYNIVKRSILQEFKMTPKVYKDKFQDTMRVMGETWLQYVSRLELYLKYYLESRTVTTFEDLKDLLVADRVREVMPVEVRKLILLKEEETWLKPRIMAEQADIFSANLRETSGVYAANSGRGNDYRGRLNHNRSQFGGNQHIGSRGSRNNYNDCEVNRVTADHEEYNRGSRRGSRNEKRGRSVNRVTVDRSSEEMNDNEYYEDYEENNDYDYNREFRRRPGGRRVGINVNRVTIQKTKEDVQMKKPSDIERKLINMATPDKDAAVEEEILTLKVTLCKNETDADHKLKLMIKENVISAMVDSGTEISVPHERCLPKDYADPVGKVMLKGAFGHRVSAKLITIPIRIHDENVQIDSMIYCAVTPTLDAGCDCLLTPKDHKLLQKTKEKNLKSSEDVKDVQKVTTLHLNCDERRNLKSLMKQVDEDDDDDDDGDYDGDDDENGIKILYLSNEEMNDINRTLSITEVQTTTIPNEKNTSIVDPTIETSQNIENIRKEQQEDETLKEAIKSLKMKNTQYYVRSLDGLLFHVENVNGREVHQLVLPKIRRQEVLKLAHDSEWAGHLAYKKTKQRINMVFFWPKMKEDIKEYCKTCNSCQMKRKVTCYDQVPINAVMRPEQPFEVMNVDVIGPFSQK